MLRRTFCTASRSVAPVSVWSDFGSARGTSSSSTLPSFSALDLLPKCPPGISGPRLDPLPTAPRRDAQHPVTGAPLYIFGYPEPGTQEQFEAPRATEYQTLGVNLPFPLSDTAASWIQNNSFTGSISSKPDLHVLVLSAGCYWCSEDLFIRDRSSKPNQIDFHSRVISTHVGYLGGDEKNWPNPSYDDVKGEKKWCTMYELGGQEKAFLHGYSFDKDGRVDVAALDASDPLLKVEKDLLSKDRTQIKINTNPTNHAEVVRILYDENIISTREILAEFWGAHDTTTLNKQGEDAGTQYRSAIWYFDDFQREVVQETKESFRKKLEEEFGARKRDIVTEIHDWHEAKPVFFFAEDCHQHYFWKKRSKQEAYECFLRPLRFKRTVDRVIQEIVQEYRSEEIVEHERQGQKAIQRIVSEQPRARF